MPLRTLPAAHQHYYLHQPNLQSPEKRYLAILTSSLFHHPPLTGRNAGSRRRAEAAAPAKTSGPPPSPPKGRPPVPPRVLAAAAPGAGQAQGCAGAAHGVPGRRAPEAAADGEPTRRVAAAASDLHAGVMRDFGAGRGADENAHSRCSSALTSAPAALLQQTGAAGSLSGASPACCRLRRSSEQPTTLWLFGEDRGLCPPPPQRVRDDP